jgi:hypothetical protein
VRLESVEEDGGVEGLIENESGGACPVLIKATNDVTPQLK